MLPTPVTLTKEERRLKFAKEVQESDQRKAFLMQQQYSDQPNGNCPTENVFYNANSSYLYMPNDGNYYNANSDGYPLTSAETNVLPYNQGFFNPNELQPSHSSLLQISETANSLSAGTLSTIEMNDSTIYPSNVHYQSSHQQVCKCSIILLCALN